MLLKPFQGYSDMVRFEKDRFVIEVFTGMADPVEEYIELHDEIATVFGLMNQDNIPGQGLYHLADLMRELVPDMKALRK